MFNRILDTIKSRMAIILAVTVIAGMAAFAGIHEYNRVYHICSTEAGVTVRAKDFLKNESDGGYFTVDSDLVDQSVPGEYVLKLKTGWFVHKCILKITDTIPPTGETKSVSVEINQECDADEFVESIEDATQVSVSYKKKPDFSRGGKYDRACIGGFYIASGGRAVCGSGKQDADAIGFRVGGRKSGIQNANALH